VQGCIVSWDAHCHGFGALQAQMQQESLAAQVAQMRAAARTLPTGSSATGAGWTLCVWSYVGCISSHMSHVTWHQMLVVKACCAVACCHWVPNDHDVKCLPAAVPANSQSQRAAALAAAAALTKRLQGIGGASTSYRDPRCPAFQAQHPAVSARCRVGPNPCMMPTLCELSGVQRKSARMQTVVCTLDQHSTVRIVTSFRF
jgi:hypothetical protein